MLPRSILDNEYKFYETLIQPAANHCNLVKKKLQQNIKFIFVDKVKKIVYSLEASVR